MLLKIYKSKKFYIYLVFDSQSIKWLRVIKTTNKLIFFLTNSAKKKKILYTIIKNNYKIELEFYNEKLLVEAKSKIVKKIVKKI